MILVQSAAAVRGTSVCVHVGVSVPRVSAVGVGGGGADSAVAVVLAGGGGSDVDGGAGGGRGGGGCDGVWSGIGHFGAKRTDPPLSSSSLNGGSGVYRVEHGRLLYEAAACCPVLCLAKSHHEFHTPCA